MARIDPLDLAFVQRLIDAALPEDQELEYKRELPKKVTDPARAAQSKADPLEEFAKDVSAMANASGGVLLYGIAEDATNQKPALYPIKDETFDHASVRLHAVLDSLIEPRLMGLQFSEIRVDDGYVLGIRVPGSFAGPHWHGKPEKRRFSVRRGGRVSEYTYLELRAAFDRNASAAARARDWIAGRVAGIKAGRTWRPLTHGPFVVLHLVPLLSYHQEMAPVDLYQASQLSEKMPRPWQNGYSHDINFDGLIIYPRPASGELIDLLGYNQLFRDGSMEIVMFTRARNTEPDAKIIRPGPIAWTVHDGIIQGSSFAQALVKNGPTMIGVSLIATNGYALPDQGDFSYGPQVSDRDDLTVPAAYVEVPENADDLERVAKTALDMIWQGFGFERCPFYDKQGNYTRQA